MNMLEIHNDYMRKIILYINNFQDQIKVLQCLLKIIQIKTDNADINMIIKVITVDTNVFISQVIDSINYRKGVVSKATLSDVNHMPLNDLKELVLKEKALVADTIELQNIINAEVATLIEHKYLIDRMLNDDETLSFR